MPKTENNLHPRIIAYDNLLAAYRECRRGKRYTRQAMRFAERLEENLINIHNHLVWGTWQPGAPRRFTLREPKMREITAPPFADRVVHHAVIRHVAPMMERRFIADSFACRDGKGAQAAVRRLQYFLRCTGPGAYVVKADIRKCFASINHEHLLRVIGRVVSCRDTLDLFRRIFAGYGNDDGQGLPIGALTSQWAANLLLDQVDHEMKDRHGIRCYLRYMDDMIMVAPDRATARLYLAWLKDAVEAVGLRLNPKTTIFPARQGVDFAGYRTWRTHILPRKLIIRRNRRRFRKLANLYAAGRTTLADARLRVTSFLAYCKHCSAAATVAGVLRDFVLTRRAA